ncbi:3-deoxy-7-phosphoheptulonate synthase [Bifidobacterium sp. B4081]|uniref:3-deoxy-7-phosphoheptulonate synthase n=1 Tax=unclassified Bifidobacterium TaxID=2608897 RepID=UPI00226A4DC1|nr:MULTISPECIES: 3-deoxy-7-phosphoheptulonate synthase [unclassified Bifidobacterium]MCX8644161.1 3-deoxy-7-phosphoheptulonate synthase [Bifidobacterium sp. B4077]MCX8645249.1 3-deoxy-7-phosphoheptulonate synthase [Bifidobacterium sp. B4081]MCX8646874.1 3-deoxy-7-phosphoheptulonate synthase [Bifidobacterium sp. B4107]MCX8651059.1 3-deoxy-7-phosphoheptulonate synthase [Bifidobacterium sp. B4111]MCX8657489.1 3-deoxy-7-phosphoheptulonate synthase [Bifidobacterium sp. B4114]
MSRMKDEPQKPLPRPSKAYEVELVHKALAAGVNPLQTGNVPRWEDEVGIGRIVNRRVFELDRLPSPAQMLTRYPLDGPAKELVIRSRQEIVDCLHGRDDRLLVIVGPCSIHDPDAALDYARRLSAVNERLKDRLLIVMRVYFEKPRTTVGWKGLINDPDLDGSYNIQKGLVLARRILLGVLETGLPAATEFLEPTSPQYISDAVSWGAIGARNTESQVHRQLASGMSMPIGFKNATDGSVDVSIDSCYAASQRHTFFGIDHEGQAAAVATMGNPDCHLVLRGSKSGPNYDQDSVRAALAVLRKRMPKDSAAAHGLLIDASHGNSGKDERRQIQVVHELARRIGDGEEGVTGLMMESFIRGGNQQPAPLDQLVYGCSITDRCISWPDTQDLLEELAGAVDRRRSAAR